jgi:hypothetical protein
MSGISVAEPARLRSDRSRQSFRFASRYGFRRRDERCLVLLGGDGGVIGSMMRRPRETSMRTFMPSANPAFRSHFPVRRRQGTAVGSGRSESWVERRPVVGV